MSRSPRRPARLDWGGQAAAILAMGGVTYGAIEAGSLGVTAPAVVTAFAVAVVALAGFVAVERRVAQPMMPLELFRSRTVAGLAVMTAGLVALGLLPSAPVWLLSTMLVLVGLGGPSVAPAATAVLLDAVPGHRAGVAAGMFNTARQVGGALAIAVFGALLATPATSLPGVRTSLLLAAGVAGITAATTFLLCAPGSGKPH